MNRTTPGINEGLNETSKEAGVTSRVSVGERAMVKVTKLNSSHVHESYLNVIG